MQDPNNPRVELYQIDEYVDRTKEIASMNLFNYLTNDITIYYNDLKQEKSLAFQRQTQICKNLRPDQMPLIRLKRVLTYLLPADKLTASSIDVNLGPSLFLNCLEELLDKFRYVETTNNPDHLAPVDNYELILATDKDMNLLTTKSKNKKLVVNLQIYANRDPDKATKQSLIERVAELSKTKPINSLDIISVKMCIMNKESFLKRKTNVVLICDKNEFVLQIDYYAISELVGGSLIGTTLDQSQEFNYDLEPFMQPIGIGCWDKNEGCFGSKQLQAPSLQFSAEYKTTAGSRGLSFVAYNGHRKVLRVDREGRKNIYDLDIKLSYHIGEFSSLKEKSDSLNRPKNCVVIKDQLMSNGLMLERLLGFSNTKAACHMGTKIVDHVPYNVYEMELNSKTSQLPILMETTRFLMDDEDSTKRYFLTYYVVEYSNSPDVNGFDDFGKSDQEGGVVSIPKFIELWELSGGKEKRMINRLEFAQFSWSLDVKPTSDPESQDLNHLFNLDSCVLKRSHQIQFRYRMTPKASMFEQSKKLLKSFDQNPDPIREILHNKLADKLKITPLNIASFNVFKTRTNGFLIDSRIVELSSGLMNQDLIGYTKFENLMSSLKDSVLSVYQNRHNINDCRLDSLMEVSRNNLVFCRGLTTCLLIDQDKMAAFLPTLSQEERPKYLKSQKVDEAECQVEQFSWAPFATDKKDTMLERVKDNQHRLIGDDVKFRFRIKPNGAQKTSEIVDYDGFYHAIEFKRLDPQGTEVRDGIGRSLVGVRYTTREEEPSFLNSNLGYKLKSSKENRFKYCELACQLDEYCNSFSICLRRRALPNFSSSSDCILSTMRLSGDHMDEIDQLMRDKTLQEDLLKVKVTTYVDSQEFKFKKDLECSIHPKDSLMAYEMAGILRVRSSTLELNDDEQALGDIGEITTLEDCAEQEFELSLWTNLVQSNFTYCPMGSLCILEDENVAKLGDGQRCYQYYRTHTQFYKQTRFTRMSVQLENDNGAADEDKNKQSVEQSAVARSLIGLSTEECARDCNLLKSKCLAFDSCKFDNEPSMCNLFSIRSPINKGNKLLGYLPVEKPFYEAGNGGVGTSNTDRSDKVGLYPSYVCNHFAMKSTYFDIRLQQLLEPPKRDEKFNKIEQDVLDADQAKSDEIRETLGPATVVASEQIANGGGIHMILLLFGVFLACFGLTYGHKLPQYARDLRERFRAKQSERFMNHRISQLALTNNQEI